MSKLPLVYPAQNLLKTRSPNRFWADPKQSHKSETRHIGPI